MYRVYNINEKNKYTNDILETIDTIDINDIQNLSSIINFPVERTYKKDNLNKNRYTKKINSESSSPKSISLSMSEEKSINSRASTPSSTGSESIDKNMCKRVRYTNSNSNSPKSISRNIKVIQGDLCYIEREKLENEEKQLLRILKNHNTITKKSINLRK